MDYDEIKTDYIKRYGVECEKIFFTGKPLVFMRNAEAVIGCCVSVGVYLAVSKRNDDRLMVEFSGREDFLSLNTSELRLNCDNEIFRTLHKAQTLGVRVGGARLFFYYNTDLSVAEREVLISSLGSFCENVPYGDGLMSDTDTTAVLTKKAIRNCLFCRSGDAEKYLPLHSERYKIVLCRVADDEITGYCAETFSIEQAICALDKRDYERFGIILNRESERLLKKHKRCATRKLFSASCELGEALGSGILQDGGIFSVVKNENVDSYVRNLSLSYRSRFGKAPDFYVTDIVGNGAVYNKE